MTEAVRRRGQVLTLLGAALAAQACRDPQTTEDLKRGLTEATPQGLSAARLTGGSPAGACLIAGASCPAPVPGSPEFERFAEVSREVRRVLLGRSDADALHVLGQVDLLWSMMGETFSDESLRRLLAAHSHSPSDPDILADLSAAFLTRADLEGSDADAVRALEMAERSLELAPEHPTASHNRALALTALNLESASAETRAPPDAALAAAIETGEVGQITASANAAPQAARALAFDRLFPDWAAAATDPARVGEADDLLQTIEALGDGIPDQSVARLAEDLSRVRRSRSAQVDRIARGLLHYGRGRALYREMRDREAADAFSAALNRLADIPEARGWADFWLASSHLGIMRYDSVLIRTQRIFAYADGERLPALVGMTHWIAGVARGRSGGYAEAAAHYALAAEHFAAAGETDNLASVWGLQAEVQKLLGDPEAAWEARVRAMGALAGQGPGRLQHLFLDAADAAEREGLLRASKTFLDVAVDNAEAIGTPDRMSEVLVRRGGLRLALADSAGAQDDVTVARAWTLEIPDETVRLRALADVWWLTALSGPATPSGTGTTLAAFDSALAAHAELGNDHHRVKIHLARAANLADVDRTAAERDLLTALAVLEGAGVGALSAAERIRFASEVRNEVSESVASFASLDPDLALEVVERSAALSWPAGQRHLHPPGDQPTARSGATLLRYAVTDRHLIVWVLRDGKRVTHRIPVGADELESAVRDMVEAAESASSAAQVMSAAERLSAWILPDTILTALGTNDLVIVPDGVMSRIPFALLPGIESEFLIQERAVTMAPTARFYFDRMDTALPGVPHGPVLVVSDPTAADEVRFPPLSGARQEAAVLADLYPSPTLLTGMQASRSSMLDAMDGAGILHFAGHSVAAPSSALGSFLVLAPEREDDSGLLYAHELAELEFTAPELVVLTACGSVAPSALYGGGFWGVAKPFLERGTRAVVGALWPVDDSGALQLSIDFHRALQEGVGPAEALRVAQMRALADPGRPVRDWAAFQVLGA